MNTRTVEGDESVQSARVIEGAVRTNGETGGAGAANRKSGACTCDFAPQPPLWCIGHSLGAFLPCDIAEQHGQTAFSQAKLAATPRGVTRKVRITSSACARRIKIPIQFKCDAKLHINIAQRAAPFAPGRLFALACSPCCHSSSSITRATTFISVRTFFRRRNSDSLRKSCWRRVSRPLRTFWLRNRPAMKIFCAFTPPITFVNSQKVRSPVRRFCEWKCRTRRRLWRRSGLQQEVRFSRGSGR